MRPLPIKINGDGFKASQLIAKQVCLHCLCCPAPQTPWEYIIYEVMGLCGECYNALLKDDANRPNADA